MSSEPPPTTPSSADVHAAVGRSSWWHFGRGEGISVGTGFALGMFFAGVTLLWPASALAVSLATAGILLSPLGQWLQTMLRSAEVPPFPFVFSRRVLFLLLAGLFAFSLGTREMRVRELNLLYTPIGNLPEGSSSAQQVFKRLAYCHGRWFALGYRTVAVSDGQSFQDALVWSSASAADVPMTWQRNFDPMTMGALDEQSFPDVHSYRGLEGAYCGARGLLGFGSDTTNGRANRHDAEVAFWLEHGSIWALGADPPAGLGGPGTQRVRGLDVVSSASLPRPAASQPAVTAESTTSAVPPLVTAEPTSSASPPPMTVARKQGGASPGTFVWRAIVSTDNPAGARCYSSADAARWTPRSGVAMLGWSVEQVASDGRSLVALVHQSVGNGSQTRELFALFESKDCATWTPKSLPSGFSDAYTLGIVHLDSGWAVYGWKRGGLDEPLLATGRDPSTLVVLDLHGLKPAAGRGIFAIGEDTQHRMLALIFDEAKGSDGQGALYTVVRLEYRTAKAIRLPIRTFHSSRNNVVTDSAPS